MGTGFIDHVTAFSSRTPNQEDRIGQFKTHRHPEAEITLLIKGEGYYASGEQNARVSAGNMILIPSAAPHSYVCIKHWEGYSLHLHELEMPAYPQYLFQQAFSQRTGPILKARLTGVHLERAAGATARAGMPRAEFRGIFAGSAAQFPGDAAVGLPRLRG